MKLSDLSKSADIANVGVSSNPNSYEQTEWGANDRMHLKLVSKWLNDNSDYNISGKKHDFIDLLDGRDFLSEDNEYDIVILHMINSEGNRLSSLHSSSNWKTRLKSTGAKYIFCFGGGSEVNHKYLGMINGYIPPVDEGYYQIYILGK